MNKILLWSTVVAIVVGSLFVPFIKAKAQVPTTTVTWTAPGDDGDVGTASFYEMRRSTTAPDTLNMNAWWSGATSVPNLPAPQTAGTVQSVIVTSGLAWGATYYFVMRTVDDGLPQPDGVARRNTSAYSNIASITLTPAPDSTPPRRIIDFIAR